MYNLILKNAYLVDPENKKNGLYDIAIKDGRIAGISTDFGAAVSEDEYDIGGKHVIPGIIDTHIHASTWLGGRYAHKMLALAGVTTALDMSGPIESVLDIAATYGAGLNMASIEYVRPGYTVSDENPGNNEIEKLLHASLEKGSIGLKILGGHYPLTPEATKRIIDVVEKNNAYVAFHAGSSATKSDINGFHEAIELIENRRVHLAHINSYCRGKVKDAYQEATEAVDALKRNPAIFSESYLSTFNGTDGKCTNGIPDSKVTCMCLKTGGYDETEAGLEKAIMEGWASVNIESHGINVLGNGTEGLKWWREKATDTTISFPVNPFIPRVFIAAEKRDNGDFVVDCLSTDGGGIPRNVIIESGLSLVKLNALSMDEFVIKTSRNPARCLGLSNKGHLGEGMDADITVLDFDSQKAHATISNGEIAMWNGLVVGKGTHFITTSKGAPNIVRNGLKPYVVER